MAASGNFHETLQQVAQVCAGQPRTIQSDSTFGAVKDQNQKAIRSTRKSDRLNSSQTRQTPEDADSSMPPAPSTAVVCGATPAAPQIIDQADGAETGYGVPKPVGDALGVSSTSKVPDHSLPVSHPARTDKPAVHITDGLRAPFISESSWLPPSTQGDDGASQLTTFSGESMLEKPTVSKANGPQGSASEAPDSAFSHLPTGKEASTAADIQTFRSAQTANPGSQTAFVEQNPADPSDGGSDFGSPASIHVDSQPPRHFDLSPPTERSTESSPQIAVLSQQVFSIVGKVADHARDIRPSASSKAKQTSHSVEANEDPSHIKPQSETAHEKPDGDFPAGSVNPTSAEGVTARRIANVEVLANVTEVVTGPVATAQTQRGSQHETATNADISAKPPSLGQSSSEDGTLNPLPDSSLTGGVIHTARLVESLKESAINLSVRSVDFGNVDIHTAMNHDRLSAQISLERNDLGNALSHTIPSLQSKLSQEHGIQATIEVQQQTSSFSANSGHSQNHTPRPQRGTTAEPPQNAQASPVLAVPVIADGRIDIRI